MGATVSVVRLARALGLPVLEEYEAESYRTWRGKDRHIVLSTVEHSAGDPSSVFLTFTIYSPETSNIEHIPMRAGGRTLGYTKGDDQGVVYSFESRDDPGALVDHALQTFRDSFGWIIL
jgi:hypothetical protein